MKKLLAVLLTVLMVLGLAACGKDGGTSGGSSGGKKPTSSSSKEKSQYSKADGDLAGFVNPAAPLPEIDEKADAMRKKVADAKDELKITGTTYYVSADGKDSNDGKSEKTPWKSIDKVASYSFSAGDGVLFRRGDVFRGKFMLTDGVSYGAYGKGDKPCIYGAAENAAMGVWTPTDKDNIYVYESSFSANVGVVVFNHGEAYSRNVFDGFKFMTKDLDFYHDLTSGKLYLRSDKGNPSDIFNDIEVCTKGHIITLASNTVIDNLCIKYGGGHAIGGGDTKNATVQNCEVGWIGGSIQMSGETTCYGNSFEIWGEAQNITVKNNYMYQCFDATITFQYTGKSDQRVETKNVEFSENLIEYGNWGVEFWYNGVDGIIKDTTFDGNIIRYSGYGFGGSRYGTQNDIDAFNCTNMPKAQNFKITNNIMDASKRQLITIITGNDGGDMPTLNGNTYIQRKNGSFGHWIERGADTRLIFNDQIESKIKELGIDANPTIIFRDKVLAN